jgi:hypothetical protein
MMTERMRALLVVNGAIVFLLGLAAGFPFAFEILQKIELWPLPFSLPFDPPGDARGWHMAHLEGLLNGLVLFAIAGVAPVLTYSARGATAAFWGFLVTAWGNTIASIIAPLTETRGLAFGGFWNSVVYLLFVVAIVAIFVAIGATLRAGLRSLGERR